MAENIRLIRIETKLAEVLKDTISFEDLKDPIDEREKKNIELTRNLAAFSIRYLTNVDYDICGGAVTDGYHDYGIDAVFIDEINKRLVLSQSKWSKNATGSIETGDLHKFIAGVKKVMQLDFTGFNKRILDKESRIRSALSDIDYKIEMVVIYSSDSNFSKEATEIIEDYINNINQDDSEIINYKIIKLSDIYDYLAKGVSSNSIDLENVDIRDWGVVEHNENIMSYYGTVSTETVVKWYENYQSLLLEKNIRSFKGDTDVNKGIMRVLNEEPENFIYYNNGIKIISKKISRAALGSTDRKVGIFKFENASIVNGAQTYGSIAEAYKKNPEQVRKARVLVQVVNLENQEDKFGENVTKLSNTQNRVEGKDFAALDPIQEKLRKELLMDGIDYIYKAGGHVSSPEKYCTLDEATIALACCGEDLAIVTNVKRAFGSIFDNIEKQPYKKIFNSSTNSYRLWNSVIIYRLIEKSLNSIALIKTGQQSLIASHGNRFISHIVFDIIKNTTSDMDRTYLELEVGFESKLGKLIEELVENITEIKARIYPDAYPANIFKNNSRCLAIKNELISHYNDLRIVSGIS